MISDKDTNFVYFSSLIKEQFPQSFKKVQEVLDKHSISYGFLECTKDIWCRDYMPIQLDKDRFVQFQYNPSYLDKYPKLKSDPKKVLAANGISAQLSDINLDGGNVVKVKDKAIITDRVFKENSGISHMEILKSLETSLEAEIFTFPAITNDMTGHSDGYLRFVSDNQIVVSEVKNEYKYWITGFEKMIRLANLDYVEIPSFFPPKNGPRESAIGCYVNYLEVGNLILFPIFQMQASKDQEAEDVIKKLFPERIIKTVNINDIAEKGGLLNCISWTIKKTGCGT